MSLAETRIELTYQTIRFCFENKLFGTKVDLSNVEGATFEEARKADHQERDFVKSARFYHSLLTDSQDSEEKVWAFGGLVLQLINARAFRQAREFIKVTPPKIFPELPEDRHYFLEADAKEKEGRLEFSERGYFQAVGCFLKVKDILNKQGKERWTTEDAKAFSTAAHFLGVSLLKQAEAGISPAINLYLSRRNLKIAIVMDEDIRGSGIEETVGYGHQHLAENYIIAGDLDEADRSIEEARKHFEAYTQTTPDSNILTGYFAVKSKIQSLRKNRNHF